MTENTGETFKKVLEDIYFAGIEGVDPKRATEKVIEKVSDTIRAPVNVVGFGKAVCEMAIGVLNACKDRVQDGFLITKYGHRKVVGNFKVYTAGHPIPDKNGVYASQKLLEFVKNKKGKGDFIVLISGGGSSLFVLPYPPLQLEDKKKITQELLNSGATIHQINAVRKHLSAVKGGRLANLLYPGKTLSLILSDVIGDDLSVIASGTTSPDESTFKDALNILNRYRIRIPQRVKSHLYAGISGKIPETPGRKEKIFQRVKNLIVANNKQALKFAKKRAEKMGYETRIVTDRLSGEAKNVAEKIADEISEESPKCFLFGGEPTVSVRGNGKGGRAQELALSFALKIKGRKNIFMLSAGTDGQDGPTDAAGAFVNGNTVQRAIEKGLDPEKFLENNDSYTFFHLLGDLFKPGPTGTNVMDIYIVGVQNFEPLLKR